MAYAYVQGTTGTNVTSGTTMDAALTGVTAGNLLVAAIRFASQTRTVVSFLGGGTWVLVERQEGSSSTMEVWYCQNATGGDTTATATMSAALTAGRMFIAEYSGIKTSGALNTDLGALNISASSPGTIGPITTTDAPNLILTVAANLTDSRTLVAPSDCTERVKVVNGMSPSGGMMFADKRQAATGEVSATWTWTGGTLSGQMVIVAFEEIATGPAIDTQPTAQTARLNGDATTAATFTVAATTSGGPLVYDWELEDGVASGVYANVVDGSGATWTGVTSASVVGTFTATTLTGRRLRCNVTDNNGTTSTNAVALTIHTGPVLSASSGVTNGSGVITLTITSDDPNTTNGEFTVIEATDVDDGAVSRTTIRPATP